MFCFCLRGYYPLGLNFPVHSTNKTFCNFLVIKLCSYLTTPNCPIEHAIADGLYWKVRFGLLRFRSPLLTKYNLFIFLLVLKCFTSQGALCANCTVQTEVCGFPHSEISGSKVARHLPKAYRSYATSFIAT